MKDFNVINSRLPKVDARVKVTGDARYAADLSMPNMLSGRFFRVPLHTQRLSISTHQRQKD